MSTPTYAPPSVDSSGLTVAAYPAILADNLQIFLNIYGVNQYIAPDSAIYQFISALSLKQADANLGLQLTYNQASPQTAVGAGLDRQVKMNGIAREPFSYSFATLAIVGTPLLPITDGFAQDQNGNLWALPSSVIITSNGTLSVTAVCTTPGAVAAAAGTIDIINTPTAGWTSVTNPSDAEPGLPIEPDSKLRARQSISVALPSTTPLASTIAAVLAAKGVVRVAPGYPTPGGPGSSIENPTGAADSWGNPAHSISIVAECSNTVTVAEAIYAKKTIGCFTNGTTTVAVVDSVTGVTEDISFFLPTNYLIFVYVNLTGYGDAVTTASTQAVQTALVNYLNALAIGETVSIGALYFEVMNVNNNIAAPTFGTRSLSVGVATAQSVSTFTLGATSVTVTSAAGIVSGQLVSGPGIAPGTFVSGAPSGTTVGLSLATTAASTGSGVNLSFSTLGAVDVPMPNFYYAAAGSDATVSVVSV